MSIEDNSVLFWDNTAIDSILFGSTSGNIKSFAGFLDGEVWNAVRYLSTEKDVGSSLSATVAITALVKRTVALQQPKAKSANKLECCRLTTQYHTGCRIHCTVWPVKSLYPNLSWGADHTGPARYRGRGPIRLQIIPNLASFDLDHLDYTG